jgi:hypothetical protein
MRPATGRSAHAVTNLRQFRTRVVCHERYAAARRAAARSSVILGRTAARKGVQAFISRGTEGLQTRRWRKEDSNRWSHLRVSTTAAPARCRQPPASELDL